MLSFQTSVALKSCHEILNSFTRNLLIEIGLCTLMCTLWAYITPEQIFDVLKIRFLHTLDSHFGLFCIDDTFSV